jgi:steroid delta-isomerase-like uncharacterized protein
MKEKIFNTGNDLTGLILRLTLGLIIFPHGAQKVFGWFGGPGFTNEMNYFTQTMHIPWLLGLLVIVIEFFGSISLLFGFASRLWSAAIILLFIGIIFSGHLEHGFFMNWFGNQQGEGYEYHLLIIGLSLAIIANGSGKYSVDNYINAERTPIKAVNTVIILMLPGLLISCSAPNNTNEENNKKIVMSYFNEAWNKGDLNVLDSLLSEDYINHTPSTPNPPKGPAGLKPIILAIRKGFPDLRYDIKEIITTNDRVVARVVMTGTQTDTLFGIPPSGRRIEVNQINIERIENGKITEHWRVTDELTMMKQLGLVK